MANVKVQRISNMSTGSRRKLCSSFTPKRNTFCNLGYTSRLLPLQEKRRKQKEGEQQSHKGQVVLVEITEPQALAEHACANALEIQGRKELAHDASSTFQGRNRIEHAGEVYSRDHNDNGAGEDGGDLRAHERRDDEPKGRASGDIEQGPQCQCRHAALERNVKTEADDENEIEKGDERDGDVGKLLAHQELDLAGGAGKEIHDGAELLLAHHPQGCQHS